MVSCGYIAVNRDDPVECVSFGKQNNVIHDDGKRRLDFGNFSYPLYPPLYLIGDG